MNLILSKPLLLSILLHTVAFGMLLVSLDLTPTPRQTISSQEIIIDAVSVNNEQVELEIAKIKEIEQQKINEELRKQQALEQQLKELQKQTNETEQKRKAEEKRLVDLKQRQQNEEKKRKEEELKLADVKKQQEALKKQREEQENKRLQAAEQKKQAEIKLAEEKKRLQAEASLKRKLAEEERQQNEAQDRQDVNEINSYVARITVAIEREFNTAGLPPGLSCILRIRMIPGGDVVEARIDKSSGNAVFDSRAEIAVKRASPLPVPDNPRIFGKMREIRLTFDP
ncbi:MAG: colicin import membrane protein [Gammaproteobacteria bacterium]|jgi:colicin import membrane protein